jgi:hypothetical protein
LVIAVCKFRALARRECLNDRLFNARLAGQLRMRVELELCFPVLPGYKNRDLREAFRRLGLKAQVFAE